ncbi:hypothetical protein J3R30DRAFT_3401889 [Lentinula aciculospora]|uniref:Uncharacterized protein n=1 Tax=Lentinula aciculospora TaxID=153920 RepID=A0A9W9AP53_9AGAR|nr:hypothetical protein J3R30DRAFT_3401889 [Lentinula aciculospora]
MPTRRALTQHRSRPLQFGLYFSVLPRPRSIKIKIFQGEVHSRQRKVINPAFPVTQLRQFLSLFQRTTSRLADKLQHEELGNDGKNSPPLILFLSAGARLYPQKRILLYRAFRRSVDTFIANVLLKFPGKQDKKIMEFSGASKRIAKS